MCHENQRADRCIGSDRQGVGVDGVEIDGIGYPRHDEIDDVEGVVAGDVARRHVSDRAVRGDVDVARVSAGRQVDGRGALGTRSITDTVESSSLTATS